MFIPSLDSTSSKRDVSVPGPIAIVDPKEGGPMTPPGSMDTITNTSLAHRFIGIWIVIGLIIVGFMLWIYFAKWPRRKLRQLGLTCLPEPPSKKAREGEGGKEIERKETRVTFQAGAPLGIESKKAELAPSWSRSTDASVDRDPRYVAVK